VTRHGKLIEGRRLARNVIWNLLGNLTPLLIGIFAIPILIEGLGIERFGLLTIAWMVVGYFSLFDLGLGRALTKLVAESLGRGRYSEIPELIWTAMLLMGVLGVVGAIFVALLSPVLVGSTLKIPANLQPETLTAFYLLAASIPLVISSAGLRGVLEAHQRFGLVNAVRVPLGVITFLGPVAVITISPSLAAVVAILVIARLISWCVYAFACLHVEPMLRNSIKIRRDLIRSLIGFGGWMTISNIVGPIMVYMDRFLIGAMVSMSAVAYYATPYDVITKLWIVPGAIMGVVFPAFGAVLVQDVSKATRLFNRAVSYVFLLLFPITLVVITLANDGLTLWLGSEFASQSVLVLQLLAVGVLINSLAHVPFGLVQSAGRPDLTAKLHLMELPFYLLTLWVLVEAHGIVGAAIAWVIRVTVDTILLFVLARRMLPTISLFSRRLVWTVGIAILTLILAPIGSVLTVKVLYLFFAFLIFACVAWFIVFTDFERDAALRHFRAITFS